MTAFSADSIESSTVVGYQTVTIPAGYSLWTPTFVDVNSDGFDLAHFRLADTAAGDGTEQIQFLDEKGLNTQTWVWLNETAGMDPGWYDINTWDPVSTTIRKGVGYLITVDQDIDLLMKGVVLAGERSVTLATGYNVFGNNSPVEIKLSDISLADTAAGDGTEQIQVLNEKGVNNETWIWLNKNAGMDPGWYDINTWDPVETPIAPGKSFLITVDQDVVVTMPAAL